MTAFLRELARAFSTYRRWHAGLLQRTPPATQAARPARSPVVSRPVRPSGGVEPTVARRVRCLSEPCGNSRMALALMRTHRPFGAGSDAGVGR